MANATKGCMRQASDMVRCFTPMTIVTEKAHRYVTVISELNRRVVPKTQSCTLITSNLDNRMEGDRGALKQLLRRWRGF